MSTLARLRALKPIVAATGDRKAIDGLNSALRAARGDAGGEGDGYSLIAGALTAKDSDPNAPLQERIATAQQFEDMMKKYHRKNPSEVQL